MCASHSLVPSMDPLGARSQVVDIQSLSTWDQPAEVKEAQEVESESDTETKDDSFTNQQWPFPSPFPCRDDINRKIALL